MLVERRCGFTASPFDVARRLAGREGVVLAWSEGSKRAWLSCDPERCVSAFDPEPELACGAAAGEAGVPRWFGLLPYESRRELERSSRTPLDTRPPALISRPLWRRYRAWVEVSDGVRVVGDDEHEVERLFELIQAPATGELATIEELEPFEPGALHAARIARALELIAQGEIYEVNLARRLRFRVQGRPWDLLERIARHGLPAYALALEWPELSVVSTSPELFLAQRADGLVWTSPIKGTRPRSEDAEEDARLAQELDEDPKEIAELTMIIDVERNDLGRIAVPGSVRLRQPPRVQSHPSVHHRVATIEARVRPELSRTELLGAMLPSGSVTGAPKVRAMEVIAELEPHRRGLYTGAFGFLHHDGSLELGMAIRTLCIHDGVGEYFTGGGIVADSVPEREVEETTWKAAQYLALLADPR